MGRGIHRGFITHEELNKSLGKRNLSQENLDQAFIHILDEKIILVEKKSDFKVLRKKESSSKEEGKTSEKSDDPIRMYLREMGGVELLSREGEIAIAKRIEAGKDVMLNALSQSPITANQFFEWNTKLQNDEILVREIIDIDTNYMEEEDSNNASKDKKSEDGQDDNSNAKENENSDDDEFLSYSTSIVKRNVNVQPSGNDLNLIVDDCNYQHNLSYDSKEIHFGGGNLAVASESDGIILFNKGDDGDLDSLFSYNLSGGQAQTVYTLGTAVIGGFSNDKGCYMALLESDSNSASNYISFADGYSINGIDFSDNIIALATGNDGVQLYEWLGGSNVTPYASISTDEYAYDLKIKGDLIFVATRSGLEIFKIGI